MNCGQVMELMQRHLDGDLNHEELEQMANHLESCPECAEMMQRLKQIDQDLANLPKVTPPFSIVDSILPRLQEMDELSAASGGIAGEERGDASVSETAANDAGRGGQRYRWYRTNLARFGGLAAAAAVLGILIVQGLPNRMNISDNVARQESTASSGASTMISSAETYPAADSAAANSAQSKDLSAPQQSAPAQQTKARSMHEPVESAAAPEDPSLSDHNGTFGKVDIMGFGSDSGSPGTESGAGESVEPAPSSPRESEEVYSIADGGPIYSEVSIPNEAGDTTGFLSGDGAFTASVEPMEDGALAVVVKEVNGSRSFTSENRWHPDFAVVELEVWNESTLSYSVKMGEEVRTFAIDASTGTETEISE